MRPSMTVCLALALSTSVFSFEETTPQMTTALEKGTKWLLKAQNREGSWGLDANTPGDITCTALAGMALLANGATERDGPDEQTVRALRRAVEYITKHARAARGDIVNSETTLIQGKLGRRVHNFFAVVFLAQIYGMRALDFGEETNEAMRDTIQRLTEFIAKTQESDGSWHKDTFGSLKATGMAWLALRAAASTGIPIKNAAVDRTVKFIKGQYSKGEKLYVRTHGGGGYGYDIIYATATSVRVLTGMGCGDDAEVVTAIDTFMARVKSGDWSRMFLTVEGEDYMAAMMMSHSLVERQDGRWETWFSYIREALCKRQNADGSWVTTACINGKTFPTACALLTLETPQRLLPVQQ